VSKHEVRHFRSCENCGQEMTVGCCAHAACGARGCRARSVMTSRCFILISSLPAISRLPVIVPLPASAAPASVFRTRVIWWHDDAAGAYQAHYEVAAIWLAVPVLIAAGCRPGDFCRAGMNDGCIYGQDPCDRENTNNFNAAGAIMRRVARHGQGSARNRGRDGARTISGSESVSINGLVRYISVARRQQTLR
jgi:hypothetical protein